MKSGTDSLRIFSLDSGKNLAKQITDFLGLSLSTHEERDFEDGEYKIRPLESVRGKHALIIQSVFSDDASSVNDKLMRLLFFIGVLKESAALKITAIIPYLCFARKDRKTQPRDPVTTKYIAQLLEAIGVNHVITMDVHNLQAFQNSFRCLTDHLEAKELFVSYLIKNHKSESIIIMSPDAGGMKRADQVRQLLEEKSGKDIPLIFMEKKRSLGVLSSGKVVGDVNGKLVVIIDDLISSGGTLSSAADACVHGGAKTVFAMTTHGVFNSHSYKNLSNKNLNKLIITDSLPLFPKSLEPVKNKIEILSIAPLIGTFIKEKFIQE